MALLLSEHVLSGTIDNSVKGTVSGELRIEGMAEPLVLELQGNAQPDLAGCVLTFTNSGAVPIDPDLILYLKPLQRGHAGTISASERRRILRFDFEESFQGSEEGEDSEWVWKNFLYVEWFSHYNGRILIETEDFEWSVDLPRWKLTEEDIQEQAEISAAAANMLREFAVERYEEVNDEIRRAEEEIDPSADDEFAWERRFQEADRRADAFKELLDEAETPEEMEAIFKRVYENADRSREDDLDFDPEEEAAEFSEPDYVILSNEIRDLCDEIRTHVDEITTRHYSSLPDGPESGDFLSLIVKSGTGVTLILDEEMPYQRGFLIAHIKREIARCQKLIPAFQKRLQNPEAPILLDLWKMRDLLVQLAGLLRAG